MKRKVALLTMMFTAVLTVQAQTAIGHWRDCLDLSRVYHVEPAGSQIYAAGKGGIFCYDVTYGTLEILSKSTGLSDVGISTMAYDKSTNTLVVAYTNSNIDMLSDGRVYNLSDIKRSEISANKTINNIRFNNSMAYLATDFGIVVIDIGRHEIKETYFIGDGGSHTSVRDIAFVGDSVYAATAEGFKHIAITASQAISDYWTIDHRMDGVTITCIGQTGHHMLLATYTINPDSVTIYEHTSVGYNRLNSGAIRSMRCSKQGLVLTRDEGVVRYDASLGLVDSVTSYTWGHLLAYDATLGDDGTLWVGHDWDGLIGISPSGTEIHRPAGPISRDNVYRLVPFRGHMMLCPGGHTTTYTNSYVLGGLYTATGGDWSSADFSGSVIDGAYDVVDAVVNPKDTGETLISLWGTGIASLRNGKVEALYNEISTGGALQEYATNGLRTGALTFDDKGNLWTTVSHTNRAIAVRWKDGTWQSFPTSQLESLLQIDKIIFDSVHHYFWLAGHSNKLYVFDGDKRLAYVDPNYGSKLETEAVNAIVQDQSGNIWIGTNKGIKVIYDGNKAFDNGGNGEEAPVSCSNITISNGNFAEYLMAYENITAIAVDGNNRKWVGTAAGGIYLIANDGTELQHFTVQNSPLFSNKIVAIGIQSKSGEVFVGTDRGLQVYRSTATYGGRAPQEEVYAFPNPVRPDYEGPIAIKGLTRNAIVHITDASGHVVYSTNAFGGQAIWNGHTADGNRVASGVYYVFASDEDGGNRSVAKILVVR